jgi:hypothetical protein
VGAGEDESKHPGEALLTTLPQGVLTSLFPLRSARDQRNGENSLRLHGGKHFLGILRRGLIPARRDSFLLRMTGVEWGVMTGAERTGDESV